jgi:histidine triad (HIT) family protein
VDVRKNAPKDDECPFCKIVSGETEASVVFEDDSSVAFLDSRFLFPGHCLLIPKKHYETLSDLPEALVAPLFVNAKRLASVVQDAMNAEGTFVAVNNIVSQSVPHFHIHIVPRKRKDGLRGFFWPRHKYESESEQAAVRDALIARVHQEIGSHKSVGGMKS